MYASHTDAFCFKRFIQHPLHEVVVPIVWLDLVWRRGRLVKWIRRLLGKLGKLIDGLILAALIGCIVIFSQNQRLLLCVGAKSVVWVWNVWIALFVCSRLVKIGVAFQVCSFVRLLRNIRRRILWDIAIALLSYSFICPCRFLLFSFCCFIGLIRLIITSMVNLANQTTFPVAESTGRQPLPICITLAIVKQRLLLIFSILIKVVDPLNQKSF